MIRTALDSDDLTAFRYGTDFYLTYSDLVLDPVAFEAAHAGHQVVYIDRGLGDPGGKATIADIERGALSTVDMPAWLDRKTAAGAQYLTLYVNRMNLAAAQAAVKPRRPWLWIATLDGTLALEGFTPLSTPALVQILPAGKIGVHGDLSLVLEPTWRPAPHHVTLTGVSNDLASASSSLQTGAQFISAAQAVLHGLISAGG